MNVIDELLAGVALPKMARVRQLLPDAALPDVAAAVREALRAPAIAGRIVPGAQIAVGVGSRGLADLPILVRTTIEELQRAGAQPFIVPAMGSHGGATAAGQTAVLAALGVTEASAGCPIRASMDTVVLDTLPNGLPVHMDRLAMEADGIVVINRVKAHTSFSGASESGIVKMLTIGLGKQKGAEACHAPGFGEMARNILDMAQVKLRKTKVLFGVASIENAHERIARVAAVPAEEFVEADARLLKEAKALMPQIPFQPLDVLVVDRMGKEYSGTGTDPHVTGRASTPYVRPTQQVARMVVLDLSPGGKGNATGVGLADVITRRLFEKIDLPSTYANHLTATVLMHAKIPMTMDSDLRAIQAAVKTCNVADLRRLRLVRIPNTLHLERMEISEGLFEAARSDSRIVVEEEPREWQFDAQGTLAAL